MNEGFYIRIDTGKAFSVQDHEIDVRRPEVAKALGVPNEVFGQFGRFETGKDRIPFLRFLLTQVPVIRVRGYGVWVGIQWGCGDDQQTLKAIHKWGKKVLGPCTMLCMTNIATGTKFNSFWLPFDEAMKAGEPVESVPVEVTTK